MFRGENGGHFGFWPDFGPKCSFSFVVSTVLILEKKVCAHN